MPANTIAFLVMSSVLNAAFAFFMFAFAQFTISPDMSGLYMRLGVPVLTAIGLIAVAAIIVPWILVNRQRMRDAVLFALLPALLLALGSIVF